MQASLTNANMTTSSHTINSGPAAIRAGLRAAFGLPVLILLTSMAGFGSLARESAIPLSAALLATVGVWGLPGQLAFAELYAAGAGTVAIVLAVSLANARFLPMAIAFMPTLRSVGMPRNWRSEFALVQLLSVNSWSVCLKAFPIIAPPVRTHFYTTFGLCILVAGVIGTALGYFSVGQLPRQVSLGLILLNPLYFALVFACSTERSTVLALLLGALCGPLAELLMPSWGLLISGMVAGSLAFAMTGRQPTAAGVD